MTNEPLIYETETESQTEDRLVVEEGGDWGRNGVRGWS